MNPVYCNLYVDAENIRIPLREAGLPSEFDPRKLRALIQSESLGERPLTVVRLFFYDTVNHLAPDEEKNRQRNYLERVAQLSDTHLIAGYTGHGGKQKGVDVRLAVDALEAAWSGRVGAIGIVSGDGDFAPLADAIRRAGPLVLVLAFASSLSHELRGATDRVILLPEKPTGWALPY